GQPRALPERPRVGHRHQIGTRGGRCGAARGAAIGQAVRQSVDPAVRSVLSAALLALASPIVDAGAPPIPPAEEWIAPAEVRGLVNPIPADADVLKRGRGLYAQHCSICHGPKGHGDGPSARLHAVRARKPKDLTQPDVQTKLTDGEIFWKITTGWRRGPQIVMPS